MKKNKKGLAAIIWSLVGFAILLVLIAVYPVMKAAVGLGVSQIIGIEGTSFTVILIALMPVALVVFTILILAGKITGRL